MPRDLAYIDRDATLASLGFRSYAAYLRSKMWRNIRANVLAKAKGCACCGADATVVHHRDYEADTLRGARLNALVPLCEDCHTYAETDGEHTLADANARLDRLIAETPASKPVDQKSVEPDPFLQRAEEQRYRDRIRAEKRAKRQQNNRPKGHAKLQRRAMLSWHSYCHQREAGREVAAYLADFWADYWPHYEQGGDDAVLEAWVKGGMRFPQATT